MSVHGALAEVTRDAHVAAGRPERAPGARSSRLLFRAFAVIIISSIAAGSALATESALPNEPLHDAKIATEQVRLALAQSPEDRVVVELDIAEARLREATLLTEADRDAEADAAVSRYGEQLARAAAHLQESPLITEPANLDRFRAEIVRQAT